MELRPSLPAQVYLLAYRPDRGRLAQRSDLGLMLRAAALTELLQRGLLNDDRDKAAIGDPAPAGLDPLLAEVLEQVAASRPRRWEHWIKVGNRAAPRAVRDQLTEDGPLELTRHRVLGLFPTLRPALVDPAPHQRLLAEFTSALTDPLPRVEPWQAALVSLADAGRLRHVLSGRQRREHRSRIRDLTALAGPAPSALRHAIQARHAVESGG